MKRILITIATLSLIATPFTTQAKTPSPEITVTVSPTAKNNKSTPKTDAKKTEKLQEKGVKAIDRRLTELKKLLTKLGKAKRLAQTTRIELIDQVKEEIATLQELKLAMAAETDNAKIQEQIKSLKDHYKIYALYMPKVHLLMAVDGLTEAAVRSQGLANTFATLIEEAKAAGTDVTKASTTLIHMRSMTTDAQTQITKAQEALKPLTPSGYPANKSIIKEAKKSLDAAHKSLQLARQDAQTIRQELGITPSPKATVSASPKASPSPTTSASTSPIPSSSASTSPDLE
jgi:hypothetical protein